MLKAIPRRHHDEEMTELSAPTYGSGLLGTSDNTHRTNIRRTLLDGDVFLPRVDAAVLLIN